MNDHGFFQLRDARNAVLFAKVGKIRRRMVALNERINPLTEGVVARLDAGTTIEPGIETGNGAFEMLTGTGHTSQNVNILGTQLSS